MFLNQTFELDLECSRIRLILMFFESDLNVLESDHLNFFRIGPCSRIGH